MWSEDLKGWWQMAVVFAAGFAVLFVVAVVAGSVWTLWSCPGFVDGYGFAQRGVLWCFLS